MIDFQNADIFKLTSAKIEDGEKILKDMLINGEQVIEAFKTVRDMVVFTNKRVLSINAQGVTGKKKDFTSLPYGKIQAYSIETAGVIDMDCELTFYFSGIGQIRFEIRGGHNIKKLNQVISEYIL